MLRRLTGFLMVCGLLATVSYIEAQPPGGGKGGKGGGKGGGSSDPDAAVARMFETFDKNKDGKLSKDEITDERFLSLFERADADKDGYVTKEELKALFVKEAASQGGRGGQGGDKGGNGKDGFSGGTGGGKGGPGGSGGGMGMGGPPQPGQIMPSMIQEMLQLSDDQKAKVADLQKDVDAKLGKILTTEQQKQLQEMKSRSPGNAGGRPKD